ncbi:MAG: phenylalanine--tRNA ligase subunit beta [Pseudomonadota bacterium]|nr:phenylalanine--tRNA ligase subunit beta [Pseudomonadota bacterium]
MKISENWLREYVNPDMDTIALADALTMAGLEVESVEPVGAVFSGVVAGRVVSVTKHPNADRLSVCQVDVGETRMLQIVCGAPNVRPGMVVPCARVGARLPELVIKLGKLRGIESQGMLCSAGELGLEDAVDGLLVFPEETVPGLDVRELLDLDDRVLTLKLTPNRSDCLSVEGIAREVAAITGLDFCALQVGKNKPGLPDEVPVRLDEKQACPRYLGQVIRGINPQASTPLWIRRRLERCGFRPKNLLVDVTNYVMLELGQPLHAFDLNHIHDEIIVRKAISGEQLTLLDGQRVNLDEALVIADSQGPLAVAGVMGGLESAVSLTTRDLFLESAWFSPDTIAGRARVLNVASEAAYRFERGVGRDLAQRALNRAVQLILEYGGGACGPVVSQGAAIPPPSAILLRQSRMLRLLGTHIPSDEVTLFFLRLGFEIVPVEQGWMVTPPGFRLDVSSEADLIEEAARLFGYDHVATTLPKGQFTMLPAQESMLSVSQVRSWFVSRDYQEIITYSFVDELWEQALRYDVDASLLKLRNPISSQMGVMRSTLFGGLVDCLRTNLNYKQERVRIFEIGTVFIDEKQQLAQPRYVGGLCYGDVVAQQWGSVSRQVDLFDIKADIEALNPDFRFVPAVHPALHPTQCARIELNGRLTGWLGVLHPRWCQEYGLAQAPVLFELELESLRTRSVPKAQPLSRQPLVRRDLAIIVSCERTWQEILDALWPTVPEQIVDISLFDEYRGRGIDEGKKSLAFKVMMQDTQKTLTDTEVDEVMLGLTEFLTSRFDAVLRV